MCRRTIQIKTELFRSVNKIESKLATSKGREKKLWIVLAAFRFVTLAICVVMRSYFSQHVRKERRSFELH